MKLKDCQARAIDYVRQEALRRQSAARVNIEHIFEMCDLSPSALVELQDALSRVPICLHFHPDRVGPRGKTVLESLAENGLYHSQFVMGLSAGSVSAWPGGARYSWESELFGGAYDRAGGAPEERPKYGSQFLLRSPDGSSPRFGCCYIVLQASVSRRSTFTYLDSHLGRPERGTLDSFENILSALLTECFERGYAFGMSGLKVGGLLDMILKAEGDRLGLPLRNLDHYVEAQVHGEVSLERDAQMLIADPSFLGTRWQDKLEALSTRFSLPLRWHQGFRLHQQDVPNDFRGRAMPSVARQIADEQGMIDAHRLGLAASTEEFRSAESLQLLKRLWHVLVKFGQSDERCSGVETALRT